MEVILVSPQQRLMPGEQVTFGIQGLEERPAGGTYIALWEIEPPGSLTPASGIFMAGNKIYSVLDAAKPAPTSVSFDVRVADRPVTVTAEVRYSRDPVSPSDADRSFPRAEPVASARTTVPANVPAPSTATPGPAPTSGSEAVPGPAAGSGPGAVSRPAAVSQTAANGGANFSGPGAAGLTAAGQSSPVAAGQDGRPQPVAVTMHRAAIGPTASQALWTLIRQSANALSFDRYQEFMDQVLGHGPANSSAPFPPKPFAQEQNGPSSLTPRQMARDLPWRLPFVGVQPYHLLKAATEVFVMLNCGVPVERFMEPSQEANPQTWFMSPTQQWTNTFSVDAALREESRRYHRPVTVEDIRDAWRHLLHQGRTADRDLPDDEVRTFLYLALVRANLPDVRISRRGLDLSSEATLELDHGALTTMDILREKLTNPCFVELLWSYWHEECGLVQTMNAISWRFQNRRGPGDRDPLASMEIDPLRPLSNIVWGYVADEEHRLSVARRSYEYAHAYGLTLLGKAVPEVMPADSRPRFIEALHNLLHLCSVFYKEDDDTTVVADGFPVLNALKEVHLLLTQGASNQYGDLGWTARLEMLMQQWILARPEFREFLPRRIMVDYPEAWMPSVEAMKTLQGWPSASVLHFRDLAIYGEQILLSVRFEAWPRIIDAQDAANWARYWRPEVQNYAYAYRAVTGVDVTERPDATAPALLLRERMRGSLPRGRGRGALERPRQVVQLPMASRLEERG
jgi:hypothetical protein